MKRNIFQCVILVVRIVVAYKIINSAKCIFVNSHFSEIIVIHFILRSRTFHLFLNKST